MSSNRNDFNIKPVVRKLERTMKNVPRQMGRIALEHFDTSFRIQGFADTTLRPWKKTKSGKSNTFGTPTKRAILIGSGRLRRGTRRAALTRQMVRIVNDVPYAQAHNEGVRGNVRVSAHNRDVKTFSYNIRTRKRNTRPSGKNEVHVSSHVRKMNLPKRQFMGRSRMLQKDMKKMIIREVNKAFKSF